MFCVVYCGAALGPVMFDPEVGIDFARLLHSAQEFRWGPLVVAGDEITTTMTVKDISARGRWASTRSSRSPPTRTAPRSASAPGRTSCAEPEPDAARRRDPERKVTPDQYLTVRYAGASGDFNPIHIDDDFAQPGRAAGEILHGLWTMAQVARAQTEAAGGPHALKRLSVSSAAWASPRPRSP